MIQVPIGAKAHANQEAGNFRRYSSFHFFGGIAMWQQQASAKRKAAARARELARQLSNQGDRARVLAYADELRWPIEPYQLPLRGAS
jgi:hypothetical protein